ncbi:hypothetical protein DYBT9275_02577 [Dyadobacter sp. CECT 9275]|uniref:YdeI/OmpD-associated family protein n=1 Tax=Dyadobacter helix TaxID=2822344 RepID=A0A916JB32_9BACT|nr:YdeI/OmpD-associated family protein [Dyadobacter sp. CECT 9275]CAG5001012.1 hypothetical protein DYBT9275_02577 [Dyadobacter sp. CECT 9275]
MKRSLTEKETIRFCPVNRDEWRAWLEENHAQEKSVWLIYYKKNASGRLLSWSDAVDEALCFGWIDSTARGIDNERYMQLFSRRKPNSTWSKINKAKVERLIHAGLMTQPGLDSIEIAKRNGSWTILDDVEELVIPDDLQQALSDKPGGNAFFLKLSKSERRSLLQWLVMAKRLETRQNRILEIVACAEQQIKPKIIQWKKPE